ncbi:hypothetical protein RGR602_PB00399 (plasmid) [Rhizobium gallicum bv. gallicum R602sp]|uniref:Uncharacterized protein n=1 Tax=Rhizobium gallicum bv. gallicum R602sp TaxID=1041138 RepID=A0A0B4XB17_9HYPH|nr:hypothetical protein RGR602_PB00399 [Rhizobium gallicum bv. gallicum R602sp]
MVNAETQSRISHLIVRRLGGDAMFMRMVEAEIAAGLARRFPLTATEFRSINARGARG